MVMPSKGGTSLRAPVAATPMELCGAASGVAPLPAACMSMLVLLGSAGSGRLRLPCVPERELRPGGRNRWAPAWLERAVDPDPALSRTRTAVASAPDGGVGPSGCGLPVGLACGLRYLHPFPARTTSTPSWPRSQGKPTARTGRSRARYSCM